MALSTNINGFQKSIVINFVPYLNDSLLLSFAKKKIVYIQGKTD